MADLGDKTNLSTVPQCIFANSVFTARVQTNGDYWPEEFWTYPVRVVGQYSNIVVNYKKEFQTNLQTGFDLSTKRADYSDLNLNNQWVWRQPGIAKVHWDIKKGLNETTITVQRVKLGSNAVVRIFANTSLGVFFQEVVDLNINSTLEHEINLSVTSTEKGRIYLELQYLTKIEYTSDVVYWGGDLILDSYSSRIGKNYSGTNEISGIVLEGSSPKQRKVFLYDRSNGDLIEQLLSDNITGEFTFQTGYQNQMYVLVLDDDSGDNFNALIFDKLVARA